MTQEDFLALADKAGLWYPMGGSTDALHGRARLVEFARLIVAAERDQMRAALVTAEAALADIGDGARWYCVSRDGLAMLCLNEQNAQAMAAQNATEFPNQAPYKAVALGDIAAERDRCVKLCHAMAANLRRNGEEVGADYADACAQAIQGRWDA